MRELSFTNRVFIRLLTGFVLVSMIDTVNSMIDGIVIARFVGGSARNVMALFFPIQLLFSLFTDTLISGSGTICSKYLGKANAKKAGEIYTCVGFVLLVVSLLFTFVLCVFPETIAKMLMFGETNADAVKTMAIYLRYRGFGTPAVFLMPLFFSIIQVEGKARICNISVLFGAVVNVGLDLLGVFVFDGGIAGIGLATSLSVFAGLLVLVIYYFSHNTLVRFDFRHLWDKEIFDVIKSGMYVSVIIFSAFIRTNVINWLILHYEGETGLLAYSLFCIYRGIIVSFAIGIWNTAILMLGVYKGEENFAEIRAFIKNAIVYMFGFLSIIAVVTVVASPLLVRIVTTDRGETARLVKLFLIPFALSLPSMGVAMFSRAYFQNLGKNMTGFWFACAKEALIPIPLFIFMGATMGIKGVAFANGLESLIFVVVLAVYFMIMFLVNRREFRKMMYFEDAWLDGECALMQNKIYSLDDVSKASEKVYDFCNEHGRGKMALKLSLAVEELGNNIFTYSDVENCEMDINVRIKKDDTILSIRDNGKLFDPNKWLSLHETDEDKVKNLGLRMILQLNRKVEYVTVFDMNFLQISLGEEK